MKPTLLLLTVVVLAVLGFGCAHERVIQPAPTSAVPGIIDRVGSGPAPGG